MPIDWEALAGAGEDKLVTLGQVFSGLAIEGDGDEEVAIRQLHVRDRLSNVRIAPDTAPAPPPTSPPFANVKVSQSARISERRRESAATPQQAIHAASIPPAAPGSVG